MLPAPHPTTRAFPPIDAGTRAAFALDPAQRAAFDRDGWIGPFDLLSQAELELVRTAIDRVIADLDALAERLYEVERAFTERPGEVVCHFLGGWLVDPILHDLVFHPGATVRAATALGVDRLRLWHDQVFAKPPHHPSMVPWHQDESYWTRVAPIEHVTVNVVLDDADLDNGCLHFVSGSHRWGLLPKIPFDAPIEAIRPHLPGGARFEPTPCPARAGQATLHAARTLHGSPPNRSDRPRRAAVLNYMGPEVRVADDTEPLLRGVPRIPRGNRVEGEYFPLVMS